MIKDTINLYTTESCPKCKILKQLAESSNYIKQTDFKIIDLDKDKQSVYLLEEQNIKELPVLLVNNDFLNFQDAIKFIRYKDSE